VQGERVVIADAVVDDHVLALSYDADVVQALLPPGLTVETYDGRAWVGLIPFQMMVAPAVGPEVPWLSRFPETNVRTYVRADNGMTGHLVLLARGRAVGRGHSSAHVVGAALPLGGDARSSGRGDRVGYHSLRRRRSRLPFLSAYVDAAAPIPAAELTPFDQYLTAAVRAVRALLGRLWYNPRRAPTVVAAPGGGAQRQRQPPPSCGLPQPTGDPVGAFRGGRRRSGRIAARRG